MTHSSVLQQLVGDTIAASEAKLASEDGNGAPYGGEKKPTKEHKESKKKDDEEMEAEKTASICTELLKTADALDFVAEHLDDLVDDRSDEQRLDDMIQLAERMSKEAVGGEPHRDTGNAPGRLDIPKTPPMGNDLGGPSNEMKTNLAARPGGTGTQPYSHQGEPMEQGKMEGMGPTDSKTLLSTNENKAPGNNSGSVPKTEYPAAGVMKQAEEMSRGLPPIFGAVLRKMAAESVADGTAASTSAGKGSTVVDGGDFPGTAAEQQVPPQPAKNEGSLRSLVTSGNERVQNITPRDTVGPEKKRMAELLDHPMQSAAKDNKLNEMLGSDLTAAAGTKLSHAQATAGRALLGQILDGELGPEAQTKLAEAAARRLNKLGAQSSVQSEEGGTAVQDVQSGEEDAERKRQGQKQEALRGLLETHAQTKGEKREE